MGGLPTRPPTISHSGSGQTFEASASSRWTLFTPSFCPEALCPTAEAGGVSPALGCSGSGASGQSPRERVPCAEDYTAGRARQLRGSPADQTLGPDNGVPAANVQSPHDTPGWHSGDRAGRPGLRSGATVALESKFLRTHTDKAYSKP